MKVFVQIPLLILLVACSPVEPPERPATVPESAVWAGGIDGGAWVDCSMADKEPAATYKCSVYSETTGDLWARGDWILVRLDPNSTLDARAYIPLEGPFHNPEYVSFDGEAIHLKGPKFLVPHGEIDYPFPSGGGKRIVFDLGVMLGNETEYHAD